MPAGVELGDMALISRTVTVRMNRIAERGYRITKIAHHYDHDCDDDCDA
jgi:hypothetical protein